MRKKPYKTVTTYYPNGGRSILHFYTDELPFLICLAPPPEGGWEIPIIYVREKEIDGLSQRKASEIS